MAEINQSPGPDRHKGFARSKKLSTRVDLTPMVDLGFLLITFFIFTYHMSEPKALKLVMPADGPNMHLGESSALTVIPSGNNQVFYYHGELSDALAKGLFGVTNYSVSNGLGNIIRAKQLALDKIRGGKRGDLMLIIKPTEDSKFENVVNALDEVVINAVKHYAIVSVSEAEKLAANFR